MQNSLAKKFFAVGSAVAMTLSMAVPFAAQAAAHASGTNVSSSDGTVWFITPEGTRRAYTSAGAFLSYGFNSWSQVVAANADDLALPQGAFIPPQDGTVFCATATKGSDVAGECSLVTAGMKAAFTSAAVFTGLGFSFARAQYGDSSFLNKSADINSSTEAHKTGVLVNNNGTVQLMGATGLLGVPSLDVFNSWGYSFANVVPANAADKALAQTGVMQARMPGQLNPTWTTGSTPPPPPVGSVTASLASDNPSGGSIVASSSAVTLAKFTFSGSGTVTQVQVKRIGVSADTVLSNVYLYDGAMRLTDAASVGGGSLISFNSPSGLFMVSGSKTISVVAEIAGTATSGQTVGVQLTGFAVSGYSLGSASVTGNLHTVTSVSDLATVNFGTVTPTGTSFDATAGLEVFRSSVSIGTRDVVLSRLALRQIGSVNYTDIRNFKLMIDGVQVATVAGLDANGYAMFSFSPTTVKSGTRIISILADIVGGASRTFQFQIRNKVDVDFTDNNYNVVVSPVDSFPVGSAAANNVNAGTLIIQKATDSPSGNVTDGASSVTLAKYTLNAYGEAMKIETITAAASSSDSSVTSLRNGRILINGTQYGSTATLAQCVACTTTGGTSYTLNYIVQPGTPVTLEVQADMFDNDGTNNLGNNDTVTAYIIAGSSNVQKMTSLGYSSVPSSAIAGNAITNTTGSVTFAKNQTYSNHAIPLPQTNYKIGAFSLVGSTSEDVNITSIAIRDVSSTSLSSLYNLKVLVNGAMFGSQAGSITVGGTSTFSSSLNLVKGTSVSVEVFADINAPTGSYTADTFGVQASLSGTAVNSSAAVAASAAGQTLTIGSATLTAAQDPSTPVAAITAGSQTKTAAAFKWTSANDQFTISEIIIGLAAVTTVQNVMIKDGGNVIATQPGAASTTFSNLNIIVPANSTKILTIDLQLSGVGTGQGTSGENVQVTLHSYKKAPASSGAVTTTTVGGTVAGNVLYVYKSIPTVTNVALPTSIPIAGTNTLAKFTISSGGTGTIAWTKLIFAISTSTGVTLASPTVWDADTNTQITGSASFAGTNVTFNSTNEQQITGAKTYVLKGTLGGTIATDGNYISTSIAQPSSFVAPAIASAATVSSASFVWSDVSAQSHDFSTADWNNDYLVKNLPTDSQSLQQ